MLDQYFSGSSGYFEYPSFTVAIFTLLLALVLSTAIALTYRLTFQGDTFPNSFFQAIVLSSTVSAMVMMAVGDNLAVGFGVLGAVSIIRFRTIVRNPRNIIFIFAGLSIGIATGVFGYAIAISGTAIFCLTVFLLYYSPYGREGDQKYLVTFSTSNESSVGQFRSLMKSYGSPPRINRVRSEEAVTRYTFLVGLKTGTDREQVYAEISKIPDLIDIRLQYDDSEEQL